jgi:hypothetical protein
VAQESKATGTTGEVLSFVSSVKLHQASASRAAARKKVQAVKLHQRIRRPDSSDNQRPPRLGNYFFRKKGAGWECLEECGYEVNTETGERRRRQPYIARLSRERWKEMQQRYSDAELEIMLLSWIEGRKALKENI